jgi:hypothetical protein
MSGNETIRGRETRAQMGERPAQPVPAARPRHPSTEGQVSDAYGCVDWFDYRPPAGDTPQRRQDA